MNLIQKMILFTALILSFNNTINASDRPKDFMKEFKDIYIVDGQDIYIQRIIDFPNTTKDELNQKVKMYISRRLERLGKDNSNSNVKYYRDAYIMIVVSPAFKINFAFNSFEKYTYRIEVKDNKIRATISLNEVVWGNLIPTKDFYPFKKIASSKKHMRLFAEYATEILDSIKDDIKNEHKNNDW